MSRPTLLQKLSSATAKVVGGLWTRWGGQGWSKIRTLLPSARIDWETDAGDLWRNSIVALAVSWLGDRFPRPMIHLSKIARNGDYVPVGRHPAVDLWCKPNKFYTRRTLEKAIGLSLKVDGNAYIQKVRDRMGRVVELWWLRHDMILPTWPIDGSVYEDGYFIVVDGQTYRLPLEDVIHIRDGIDPQNDRCGLSALKSCLREVVTLNREASYTAAILKNMGIPGIVISPDNEKLQPSSDDAKRIKEVFGERFGIDNDMAGSTAVLAGQYKVTALGFSPEQMALDRLPQNAVSRICSAMGTAAMSLGLPDPGKTYSNLGEANKTSWGTVQSIQELIGEALRWGLLPEFDLDPYAYVIEYDYSNIQELQEPLDAVHARAREDYKYGVVNLNEAREMIGLEPDPDGDRYMPGTGDPAEIVMRETITGTAPGLPNPATTTQPDQNNAPAPEKALTLSTRNGWHS